MEFIIALITLGLFIWFFIHVIKIFKKKYPHG